MRKIQNRYFMLLLCLGLMMITQSSCVSEKKFQSWMSSAYRDEITAHSPNSPMKIDLGGLANSADTVKVKKTKSVFIPAIFYWHWNTTLECSANQRMHGDLLSKHLHYYADSLQLKDFLQDKSLEIEIDQIPSKFNYTNRGHVVFLLLSYVMVSLESFYPMEEELALHFSLTENGKVLSEGDISVKNPDQGLMNKIRSPKRFTYKYIEHLDGQFKKMALEAMEKMVATF